MRGYGCDIYHLEKKIPTKNTNSACFAGVQYYYQNINTENCKLQGNKKYIYIANFREKETEKYIPFIIDIINKITRCKIVKLGNVEYIQFKLLETYDQSLILLNFIRNLWSPVYKDFYKKTKYYNIDFFETLEKSKEYKDPLEKLTFANLEAAKLHDIVNSPGHSNVHSYKTLKVKSTENLLKYKGISTVKFLTY